MVLLLFCMLLLKDKFVFRPDQSVHENENETCVFVSFCTRATCLPNQLTKTKTKLRTSAQHARFCATFRILEFRHTANKNLFQALTHSPVAQIISQKKKAVTPPGTFWKELRRAIAIYIYSNVLCNRDSMKEIDQTKLIETLFFGNGGGGGGMKKKLNKKGVGRGGGG